MWGGGGRTRGHISKGLKTRQCQSQTFLHGGMQIRTFKGKLRFLKQEPSPKCRWTATGDPNWYFWLGKQDARTRADRGLLPRCTTTPQTGALHGERAEEPGGRAGRTAGHAPLRLQWVRRRSGPPLPPPAPHPTHPGACGGSHRLQLPPAAGAS